MIFIPLLIFRFSHTIAHERICFRFFTDGFAFGSAL